MLFLSTAVVRDSTGTTRLSEIGGMDERSSVFMGTFFIGSLSLIGVPPLTGFFGKLLVFEAAVDEISRLPAVGVSIVFFLLVGAFLTVVYSTRAFMGVFRGTAISGREPETLRASQVTVLGTLALLIVVVGVGFEPVYRFADAAAKAAVDTEGYVEAVLGGEV
jgi:multicomponent Na+:H+ antiporter subunit D